MPYSKAIATMGAHAHVPQVTIMLKMSCRKGCGACCIAPSLSTRIPGMPDGKPAGIRCIQLNSNNECLLFGKPERPDVCNSYQPGEFCGSNNAEAMQILTRMEKATAPDAQRK